MTKEKNVYVLYEMSHAGIENIYGVFTYPIESPEPFSQKPFKLNKYYKDGIYFRDEVEYCSTCKENTVHVDSPFYGLVTCQECNQKSIKTGEEK